MNRRLLLVLIWGLGVMAATRCGLFQEELCRVRLSLVDSRTGKTVPGVIRCFVQGQAEAVPITGLQERGQGVGSVALQQLGERPPRRPIHDWYVLSGPEEMTLPKKPLRLEAFSGLETEMATLEVNLSERDRASLTLPLKSFSQIKEKKWFGGNTHLHLFKLDQEEADRYLRKIPAADRLDLLFTSYLIRPSEDADYITNRYPVGDLTQFRSTGVLVNQGEEHRHNLTPFSGGYGHVMLLNIRKLIQPVSIGPGITGSGNDGTPLQQGIDEAHRQGGTVIWCHNEFGLERVVNFVLGKVDAQNIFDGLSLENYPQFEDTFYHYLNAGLRVPFSTGTDWFLFDLARVYTRVAAPLGIASWLEKLKQGRSFITNGPLFHFLVEDQSIGDTVSLKSPGEVRNRRSGVGPRRLRSPGTGPQRPSGRPYPVPSVRRSFFGESSEKSRSGRAGLDGAESLQPSQQRVRVAHLRAHLGNLSRGRGTIDSPTRRGGISQRTDSKGESYSGRQGTLCHA